MILSTLYDNNLITNTVLNNDHFKWSQKFQQLKYRKERQQEVVLILNFGGEEYEYDAVRCSWFKNLVNAATRE